MGVQTQAAQGAATGTGTASRNVHGHAIAITVFSTLKWWGRPFLPLVFLWARAFPKSRGTLAKLSFIHFARWAIVRELEGERLRHPHLFFESNFNGGWEEYIDAFSHVLTRGMTIFWGSSYGFPKPLPTAPFKAYIRANELEADHFWCAYPDATTTMVLGALQLEERVDELRRRAASMDPETFAREWRAVLTEAQRWL